MFENAAGVALCGGLVALTALNWRSKMAERARQGVEILNACGFPLGFDARLADRCWERTGTLFVGGACMVAVLIGVLDMIDGIPLELDLWRILLLDCLVALAAGIRFPQQALRSYWAKQAKRDGVDLAGQGR